jgi:hypothetical protein
MGRPFITTFQFLLEHWASNAGCDMGAESINRPDRS